MQLLTFDMDNTLIHSDLAHIKAFNLALQKMGYKKRKHWDIRKHFGKPKKEVAKAILQSHNPRLCTRLLNLHDSYLYKETKKHTTRIKGVLTALKRLKSHYHIAVLSNCKTANMRLLLNSANLDPKMFELLLGSDQVKKSKPNPGEIFKAEKMLKHRPAYHIGDSIYDIKAAKRARVKSIGVLTGFFTRAQLQKEKPTYIINSVADLPKLLLK